MLFRSDEATEVAVLNRMHSWLGNRTLIVATHRYPVLQLVDRIIVVDNGRIVRDGPKDEILGALSGKTTEKVADSAPVSMLHQGALK